jgi:hypothetical protein
MSERLIQIFLGDTPVHLDDQTQGESKLLWKVVLRTGTWKLRPGPGGVKLNTPLKIYRDKAPKGHISLTALKQNFEGDDKGPAKEHVTVPMAHVDGTVSDGGFVKKLVIQDVPGEDGKGVKESLLWAGMEITDSELNRKLSEKSLRGVSGGILFDYERTEDAKKFDQVLSHVMVTNSPWINGTGDFKDQLPEGVMAAEPDDLPVGEVEFSSRETDPQPQLPTVRLDDPPATSSPSDGEVIWKPEQGFKFARSKVQKALEQWRDTLMASVPQEQRNTTNWPYFSVDDVSLASEGGTALVQRRERERRSEVIAYCGQTKSDGTVVKGKLDELGLGDPGVKKFIRNALLSDDGAPAIAYSVHLEDGTSTTPVEKTSTDLLKEFIDLLPKVEQGRANLSEQARRLPDDAKPPEENNEDKLDMSAKAVADRSDALLAEMRESGYDIGTAVPTGSGS